MKNIDDIINETIRYNLKKVIRESKREQIEEGWKENVIGAAAGASALFGMGGNAMANNNSVRNDRVISRVETAPSSDYRGNSMISKNKNIDRTANFSSYAQYNDNKKTEREARKYAGYLSNSIIKNIEDKTGEGLGNISHEIGSCNEMGECPIILSFDADKSAFNTIKSVLSGFKKYRPNLNTNAASNGDGTIHITIEM